jgi:uncharacterized protein
MDKLRVWYAEGLPFECTGCGECCTGAPGYVWVSVEEMEQMAAHLQMSVSDFSRRYLRRVGDRYSLTEIRPHFDCVFLEGKKCQVYPVRPAQCRSFPFWPENLATQEAWQTTANRCEGIHSKAQRVPLAEIERHLS